MKQLKLSSIALISLVGMACIGTAGCGHNELMSEPSIEDTSSAPINAKNEDAPLGPFQDLLGTWRGASYQHETGVFRVDAPLGIEPEVSIQIQIEVEEKYLQLEGVESCHVTLTYKSRTGEEFKQRKMFRICPPKDPQSVTARSGPLGVRKTESLQTKDHITLESGVMKFEVISRQDQSMELLGRSISIESKTVSRPVRLKLSRDATLDQPERKKNDKSAAVN